MTRKDYMAIAEAIARKVLPKVDGTDGWNATVQQIAESVADVLAEDNARFDRSRFLTACGF